MSSEKSVFYPPKHQNPQAVALVDALKQSNDKAVLSILTKHGRTLFNENYHSLLTKAIQSLPPMEINEHPVVALLGAWLAATMEQNEKVIHNCQSSMASHQNSSNVYAEFLAIQSQAELNQNAISRAQKHAERALLLLYNFEYQSQLIAMSVLAQVHIVKGHTAQAHVLLQQISRLATVYGYRHQLFIAMTLQSSTYSALGNQTKTNALQCDAIGLAEALRLHQWPLYERLIHQRFAFLFETNQATEVESFYEHVKTHHAGTLHSPLVKSVLTIIACAYKKELKAREFIKPLVTLELSNYPISTQIAIAYAKVIFWRMTGNSTALRDELKRTEIPHSPCVSDQQMACRTQLLAYCTLDQENALSTVMNERMLNSQNKGMMVDRYKNHVLLCVYFTQCGDKKRAEQNLLEAIRLSQKIGMIGDFYLYGDELLPLLKALGNNSPLLKPIEKHHIKHIINQLNSHHRSDITTSQLKTKFTSGYGILTEREWDILAAIYADKRNPEIATQLSITPTTVKTHIRNIYKKLKTTNREQAINLISREIKEKEAKL